MTKYILCFILGMVVSLIIVCIIFACFTKQRGNNKTTYMTDTIHIDTIYIERDVQPVSFVGIGRLEPTRLSIPIKIDTTGEIIIDNNTLDKYILSDYLLPDFIVSYDTIVNKDTFSLKYEFPRNLFTFDFEPHRDSIIFQQITIETKTTKTNWLTTLAISTGTGIIGYLIGNRR